MSPTNRLATIDTKILSILFDDPEDPDDSDNPQYLIVEALLPEIEDA